ncbi:MAG: 2-C-methyl-D-erythritol 4-phosphate cytidylyltransferase [Bacteroidetes bacterium]|nr:2-C-methyl-D-erythritol 4-phosphate cytidylyltransferase [Bacteroidota bacterium]
MKTFAIIPSGGSGTRTSFSIPKQYVEFEGKELIAYTLEIFQKCDMIDEIVVAAQPDFFKLLDEIKKRFSITKLKHVIEGGSERQLSVQNALRQIEADDNDLIAVHDAARPLLPQKVLSDAINSAKIFDSVVVAISAKDTLIKGNEIVDGYIDRKEIYYAQTPQVFRYKILNEAMKKAVENNFIGTDESMLVKMASYNVRIVEGSSLNFKVTTDEDIELFGKLCKQ